MTCLNGGGLSFGRTVPEPRDRIPALSVLNGTTQRLGRLFDQRVAVLSLEVLDPMRPLLLVGPADSQTKAATRRMRTASG